MRSLSMKVSIPLKPSLLMGSGGAASLLFLLTSSAYGLELETKAIDWFALIMTLCGGLALFLAGLDMLSDGLKKAAGKALKLLLAKMTTNRFLGAITGAFVTAVLNSSSVTTVLLVSFITAGVMTLQQSVGVIMGANIGSTITAQLLAFNVSAYALLPIAVGFFMTFTSKTEGIRHLGEMIMGLGLVFFGMGIMSQAMTPLRDYEPFMDLLKNMEQPSLGILAGAVFTGLVQSSAATVGLAIAMASEGLLSLPAGIALALGANIGTCITALLASIGKPVEAIRAAVVHISFNIIGVLIWLPFIHQLASLSMVISPHETTADIPRQIANANTLFNCINTLLFIGFTRYFSLLVVKLVPDRPEKEGIIVEPKFLDDSALAVPSVALEQVRKEFGHMGQIATTMLSELPHAISEKDRQHVDTIVLQDDKIDILEAAIFRFLSKIRQQSLTEEESKLHQDLMAASVNLETLADVIETQMSSLAKQFISHEQDISEKTNHMFSKLYKEIHDSIELAVIAVRDNNQNAALQVIRKQKYVSELSEKLISRKSERLGRDQKDKLETARIAISLVDKLQRTYNLACRIANVVIPASVEQKKGRQN